MIWVYSQFLLPASVNPKSKAIESLDIMVQMVGLARGVTVLPRWLAYEYSKALAVTTYRPSRKKGLTKTLFAATRKTDIDVAYIQKFVALGRQSQPTMQP